MEKCIFCEIVAKRIPTNPVYEDDDFMAFLSIKPINPGHTLIVPKPHARWVYDVEKFGYFWEVAKSVALAAVEALKADTVNFMTLGYEVPHAHIHAIPRFKNDGHDQQPIFVNVKKIPKEEMVQIAEKLKAAMSNHPPKKVAAARVEKAEVKESSEKRSKDDVAEIRREVESG